MTDVQFFGRLREAADRAGVKCAIVPSLRTVDDVIEKITRMDASLGDALQHADVRCVIDGGFAADNKTSIADCEEIAFIPPVSGG